MEGEWMTKHRLKLNDRYFDAVANRIKTFEIRKYDRGFRVGDTLVLYRVNDAGKYMVDMKSDGTWVTDDKPITWANHVEVTVKYILTHDDFPDGIPEGYVVMAIERVKE
jgi:hypothetical protein